jgi:hypothetical protein
MPGWKSENAGSLVTQRSENTRERVKRVNKTTQQQQQVEGNFKHFPHERSCTFFRLASEENVPKQLN